MKFLLLLLPFFLFSAPPIVFVHLGPHLPGYLQTSISQARLFNPHSPIYLISNGIALRSLPRSFPSSQQLTTVSLESIPKTPSHQQFISKSRLDRIYREGFWTYTTQRFFVLNDFMKQRNLTDVFHLESDVMLYTDLETLLPHCQAHYSNMIAVPSDSDSRCIASLIYVSNPTPLTEFTQFVADRIRLADNDMHFLAHFRNNFFKVYIDHFPVIMPDYVAENPLISGYGDTTQHPERYTNHFDEFQSLFDAAAIGQYLGGIDPRNGESKPGFINETTLFNVSAFQFEWFPDSKNRLVPYLLYKDQKIRVNNLHIHSKNLVPFRSTP